MRALKRADRVMARPREGPFHASVPLGRVAGVRIGLHWSWFLALVLFAWTLGGAVFPAEYPGLSEATYAVMAVTAALALFACLLAHELGHALQARREHVEIDGITLWVFGGIARIKGMFPSAGAELRIACAGPAVSLALGLALSGVAALHALPAAIEGVVAWLGGMNLLLLAFNLLPALPLDGGRVLRALLWHRSGDFARATRTTGRLGVAIGRAMVAGGVLVVLFGYVDGLWLALIGWFVGVAARGEVGLAEASELLAGLTVADTMVRDPVVAAADDDLEAFTETVHARSCHAAYPVVDGERLAGRLAFRALAGLPAAEWSRVRVRDVAETLDRTLVLRAGEPLFDATVELMQSSSGWALVADGDRLAGVLTISDVSRTIELRRLSRTVRAARRDHRGALQ